VRSEGDAAVQLSYAEDLDQTGILLDESGLLEFLRAYLPLQSTRLNRSQIDDLINLPERAGKADLRQVAIRRHLPPFKTDAIASLGTGSRPLALVTLTGCLARARSVPLPQTLGGATRTRRTFDLT